MIKLNVLIIEDTPEWASDISEAFHAISPGLGIDLKTVFAENLREAEEKSKSFCLHGISTDQNMPETIGGDVSSDHGKEYIRNLQSWDPPAYMAVYTAFPHTAVSNIAGQKGIQDYITKSDENTTDDAGNQHMRVSTYANYFLKNVETKYLQRVFSLAQHSCFQDLRNLSRRTATDFERFMNSNRTDDEDAERFVLSFFALQESFNRILARYFESISADSSLKEISEKENKKPDASYVETRLRRALNFLENKGSLLELHEYLHLGKSNNISGYYIDSCEALRKVRNRSMHSSWKISVGSYNELRSSIVRICDVLAWFLRRPLLISPRRTREYFLQAVDISREHPERCEFYFEHDIPDAKPYELYTMLSQESPLAALEDYFSVKADTTTGDPVIEFEN